MPQDPMTLPPEPMPGAKVVVMLTTNESGRDSIIELRYLDSTEDVEGQVDALVAHEVETRQPGFQIGGVQWVVGDPVVMATARMEAVKEKTHGRRQAREALAVEDRLAQTEELSRQQQAEVDALKRQRDALAEQIRRQAGGQ